MSITRFGQWLKLTATDKAGVVILETSDLRVDFDIRDIKGFTKAKFDIYNLTAGTINRLSNGEVYISLDVRLHDGKIFNLVSSMYVSNAIEEVNVPDSITSLFCTSRIKQEALDVDTYVLVNNPTLRNKVLAVLRAAGFTRQPIFKFFPDGVLDDPPLKPKWTHDGTLLEFLVKMSYERFDFYTQGLDIYIVYRPDYTNMKTTEFYEKEVAILLDTKNMRANPRLGPSTLSLVSNLDPRIVPSSILDVSDLLTAAPDVSEIALKLAKDLLKDKVAGFDRYRVVQVQHKGSNFTRDWNTSATAISPVSGKKMATNNWFT